MNKKSHIVFTKKMNIEVQTVAGYLIPALNRKTILYCKIENGTLVRISSGCRI